MSSILWVLFSFSLLNFSYSSLCIKPFNLKVAIGEESYDLKLFQDGEEPTNTSTIKFISDFVEKHGLSEGNKIHLLEKSLEHAISFTKLANSPKNGLFVTFDERKSIDSTLSKISLGMSFLGEENFPIEVFTTSTVPRYQLCLDTGEEFISNEVRSRGSFGPISLVNNLVSIARKSDKESQSQGTVVDVGANIGTISYFAASLGERVISIEPLPKSLKLLYCGCGINGWCPEKSEDNLQNNHNQVVIIPYAASNTSTQAVITYDWHYLPQGGMEEVERKSRTRVNERNETVQETDVEGFLRNSGAATMMNILEHSKLFDESNLIGSDLKSAKQVQVKTTRLDEVLLELGYLPPLDYDVDTDLRYPDTSSLSWSQQNKQQQQINASSSAAAPRYPRISVLKLDCEGCEPLAVEGAERMFRYNPPQFIITEVYSKMLLLQGWSVKKYFKFFVDRGYELYDGAFDRQIDVDVKIMDKFGNAQDDADDSFYAESYICKHKSVSLI